MGIYSGATVQKLTPKVQSFLKSPELKLQLELSLGVASSFFNCFSVACPRHVTEKSVKNKVN
jgi:hypothetical protein